MAIDWNLIYALRPSTRPHETHPRETPVLEVHWDTSNSVGISPEILPDPEHIKVALSEARKDEDYFACSTGLFADLSKAAYVTPSPPSIGFRLRNQKTATLHLDPKEAQEILDSIK